MRAEFRVLLILFIALLFYNIGAYPVWNKDEGLYAEAVRYMIEHGNFLEPYFNQEYRWQKPILIYWVLTPFSYFLGADAFSLRLSLFFLALATLLMTYLFAKKLFKNTEIALLSAFFLISSTSFVLQARHIATHMLLLFTIMLAFYFLYDLLYGKRTRKVIILFGASVGLAFLAKLYVGVVFIVTTAFLLGINEIKNQKIAFSKGALLGTLSFALVAFPWYIYMYITYGNLYVDFLYHEFFDRISTNVTGKNSPLFYTHVFLGNFAPWSIAFIALALYYAKSYKKVFQNKELLMVLTAFLAVFITLSIPKSKLPGYLFYLQGFASILMALAVYHFRQSRWVNYTFIFIQVLLSVALVAIWVLYFDYASFEFFFIALVLIALFFLKVRDIYTLVFRVGVVALLVYFTILGNIYSEIRPFFGYERFGKTIERLTFQRPLKVYFYNDFRESLPFYAKTKIIKTTTLPNDNNYLLIIDEQLLYSFNLQGIPLERSAYYKGSDSNVFKILNIIKGYRQSDRVGNLLLIEVRQ